MSNHKAIFIDVENQSVTGIELRRGASLQMSYDLIGCSLVEQAIYLNDKLDAIIVDEEGYFKEGLAGFYYDDCYYYYGNAIIWGVDSEGELADVHISLDEVKNKVTFVNKQDSALLREKRLSGLGFYF